MTNKQYVSYIKNPTVYVIKYQNKFTDGIMTVDTKYYNDNIKKFNKVFKDVFIYSFEEKEKEDD